LGTLRVTKACLPLLKSGAGRILMVSSVAGMHGYPGLSVYCATKHAIEGLAQVIVDSSSTHDNCVTDGILMNGAGRILMVSDTLGKDATKECSGPHTNGTQQVSDGKAKK
jgi:hypothetical protein